MLQCYLKLLFQATVTMITNSKAGIEWSQESSALSGWYCGDGSCDPSGAVRGARYMLACDQHVEVFFSAMLMNK